VRPIPSVPGHRVGGATREYASDPIGFFMRAAALGETVRIPLAAMEAILFINPDSIKQVLVDKFDQFSLTPARKRFQHLLGKGLLTNDDTASWFHQRRLLQPAFHRARIAGFIDIMATEGETLTRQWEQKGTRTIDAAEAMLDVTLRIVCLSLFGADVSEDALHIGHLMDRAVSDKVQSRRRLWRPPLWVPTPANLRFKRFRSHLRGVVQKLIDARRGQVEDRGDLLSLLMNARDADTGERMPDKQVLDETLTFFLGGHETTSIALAWTLYLLAKNPAIQDRLRDEIRSTLAGRPPAADDLPKLPFTDAVVKESMRLYPPAWIVSRVALADVAVDDTIVKKGNLAFMSPYVTHRHPPLWDEPEVFRPERFEAEAVQKRPRFAYFPFGGGPRQCIGGTFAMAEAQTLLAVFVQKYRFGLTDATRPGLLPGVTLRPHGGLPLRIEPV
jgi:cytochrome P450